MKRGALNNGPKYHNLSTKIWQMQHSTEGVKRINLLMAHDTLDHIKSLLVDKQKAEKPRIRTTESFKATMVAQNK